jgi:hypothetical protein
MEMLLGDMNAKVGREDIFRLTIGNGSSFEISNDNGVRLVNFDTRKNLTVKSTMFPHHTVLKYTCTAPDRKTHNQIGHILVDTHWHRHSSVLDVQSLKAADCDTDHYLVVANVMERLSVNTERSHRFHMERFNLKKLNEVEVKKQYPVEV